MCVARVVVSVACGHLNANVKVACRALTFLFVVMGIGAQGGSSFWPVIAGLLCVLFGCILRQ